MPLYTIFMQKIANQLESRGFKVVAIEKNKKHPDFYVWKFEDTLEFRNALHEILQ